MDTRKKHLVWLAPLLISCSTGCTPNQEAPLADGLRFKYRWNVVTDVMFFNVTIKEVDGEHFVLDIETKKAGVKKTGDAEIRVDRFFKTDSGKLAMLAGKPFWLPSYMRKVGTEVVDDGSITIRKESTWEGWDVWVAGGGNVVGSLEWYYDKKTGFLVGSRVESMGSGMGMKLLKTNAPGL